MTCGGHVTAMTKGNMASGWRSKLQTVTASATPACVPADMHRPQAKQPGSTKT